MIKKKIIALIIPSLQAGGMERVMSELAAYGEYWNNFVLMATFGLRFPVYISDRSQPNKSLGKLHDWLRVVLYKKAQGIILQTQKAKEIYQEKFSTINIDVIGNPIREIENTQGYKQENKILMVGRLIESKHQDRLIKIFSQLKKPNWKLIIVGYDHLNQNNSINLKKLITKFNLEDNVVLAGKQSNVERYYLTSKIFAFTSSSEGFPNVIGEAMAAGLPVVSYDCIAGPSEMISDMKNGFLVPLFDDDTFAMKLNKLMEDEDLRKLMGTNAKKDIKKFDRNIISKEFLEFIFSHEQPLS